MKSYGSLAEYIENTKGMTHERLARVLGISRSYVTLLVSGDRQPGLELALLIEEKTGVPASALVSKARAS